MGRKSLDLLIELYNKSPEGEKSRGNIVKFFLRGILRAIFVEGLIYTIIFSIILLPVLIICALFLTMGTDQYSEDFENDGQYGNAEQLFTKDMLDIPLGIPVEIGRITVGFDQVAFPSPIVTQFLNIPYKGTSEYLKNQKHQGIDFGKTLMDKLTFKHPTIYATHRGVVYEYESFTENGKTLNYTKSKFTNGSYGEITSSIPKNLEWNNKPYGNHVITSTLDGKFYIMYGHMSEININILKKGEINRGMAIGKMGSTGRSTGEHLHYEIRFCGMNNKTISKLWKQCIPINPLGFVQGRNITYLGFKEFPATNQFTAGNIDIKNIVSSESETKQKIITEEKKFCTAMGIMLIDSNVDCNELFAITYPQTNNELFPKIKDQTEAFEAVKKYINTTYPKGDIKKIAEGEGLKGINNKDLLYKTIALNLSFGKYQNKQFVYKIKTQLSKKQVDEMNLKQMNDVITTLGNLKKNGAYKEALFLKYFGNTQYTQGKNPFVYNFIDKDHIFLDILDLKGGTIGKYNKDGSLKIYNIIQ